MEHCHLHMKIWVILNGMGSDDDKQEISKIGVCCIPLQFYFLFPYREID